MPIFQGVCRGAGGSFCGRRAKTFAALFLLLAGLLALQTSPASADTCTTSVAWLEQCVNNDVANVEREAGVYAYLGVPPVTEVIDLADEVETDDGTTDEVEAAYDAYYDELSTACLAAGPAVAAVACSSGYDFPPGSRNYVHRYIASGSSLPTTTLRNGYYNASRDKGFGWTKILQKHGIRNMQLVADCMKFERKHEDDRYVYRCAYYQYQSGSYFIIPIRVVVNLEVNGPYKDGFYQGVITMYCEGYGRAANYMCPDAVNGSYSVGGQ